MYEYFVFAQIKKQIVCVMIFCQTQHTRELIRNTLSDIIQRPFVWERTDPQLSHLCTTILKVQCT